MVEIVQLQGDPFVRAIADAIAEGLLTGLAQQRFGYFSTPAVISTYPIRATTYTEPSANAQRSVGSSSVNDTAAGSGARTVRITYLSTDMATVKTTDVTLNGTTAVNTSVSDIHFIEKIEVLTVGATGANAGTITLFGSTAGAGGVVGTIAAGDNQTFWAHHYIRTAVKAIIKSLDASSTGNLRASLRAIDCTNANAVLRAVSGTYRFIAGGSGINADLIVPIMLTGPMRVEIVGRLEAATAVVLFGSFGFYEAA
jgi:hypothetical protein